MNIPQIPFSVTGRSTIFGLNYDGSIDRTDNGRGAFGFNTRDRTLIGCSLPIPVIKQTFNSAGIAEIRRGARIWNETRKIQCDIRAFIQSHTTGRIIGQVLICDEGPALWTGNCLDCTYGLKKALGEHDNSIVTYWIMGPTGPFQIKGWNFTTHHFS
jgi:hypothetical protein